MKNLFTKEHEWQKAQKREAKLLDACERLATLIRDAEIPEGLVRRCLTFELAEYIYNDHQFWRD